MTDAAVPSKNLHSMPRIRPQDARWASFRTLTLDDFRPIERNGEPRVRDLRLAGRLQFERPRAIRHLIERNLAELEKYGSLPRHVAVIEAGKGAQHRVAEYWLNEDQAVLITMRSDPPVAEEDEKGMHTVTTPGGRQQVLTISEADVAAADKAI